MNVRLINLEGKVFDLTFQEEVTIKSIRQKLLKEYNYNTDRCYFCRSGQILENETHFKEIFAKEEVEKPIIIFNFQQYPDKSFPKVDDAFLINFSRYSDYYSSPSGLSSRMQAPNQPRRILYSDLPQSIQGIIGMLPSRVIITTRGPNQSRNSNQILNRTNSNISDSDNEDDDETILPNNSRTNPPGTIELELLRRAHGDPFMDLIENGNGIFIPSDEMISNERFHRPASYVITDAFDDPPEINNNNNQRLARPSPERRSISSIMRDITQTTQRLREMNNQLNNNNNEPDIAPPPDQNNERRAQPAMGIGARHNDNGLANFLLNNQRMDANQQIIEGLNMNINLTEQDRQAITRLTRAGYDRATVIQVYEACERNEEAALNLLVSMG